MPPEDDKNKIDDTHPTVEAKVSPQDQPKPTDEPIKFEFDKVVPEAYRGKEYLKGIDSFEKLFSKFDGAETLLGKRPAGIPADDAKPEEVENFYSTLRPKEHTEYEIPVDNIPESMRAKEESITAVKQIYHKAGLSKHQAKVVNEGLTNMVLDAAKAKQAADEKNDVDFDKLGDDVFGADKDKVLASSKKIIQEHVDPKMAPHMETLPNESLIILASVVNNLKVKYMKEDEIPTDEITGTGMTAEQIREKGRKLMASEAYTNVRHPDHKKTVDEVAKLYKVFNK